MGRTIFTWILSKAVINKEFVFKGDLEKFEYLLDRIRYEKNLTVLMIDQKAFEITDDTSFGTMIVNYVRAIKGITLYGTIVSVNAEKVTVQLKTKIRVELYLMAIISLTSLIAMIIKINTVPFWPFLFPIITIPWFNWIYMIQSTALLRRVIKYFDLKQ